MNLSETFQKTYGILFKARFCENQTKNITANIRKIFDEFLVNFRPTVGDSYFSKFPTILIQHFLQVYFSKDAKI